jgi:hypothetical protein
MFTSGIADYDVTKPDHPIISFYWHAASNAHQETESIPHLGNDCSCQVVTWLMQPRDDNVMAADTSKGVDIVIGWRLRQSSSSSSISNAAVCSTSNEGLSDGAIGASTLMIWETVPNVGTLIDRVARAI